MKLQDTILFGLKDIVGRLLAGGKIVIIVGPIATPGFDVTSQYARKSAFGHDIDIPLYEEKTRFRSRWNQSLTEISHWSGVDLIRPDLIQCSNDRCRYFINDVPLFADSTHITNASNRLFVPLFDSAIKH